jgi:uncharacterized protein (DUF1697 family)
MFLRAAVGRTQRRDVQALATPQDAFHVHGREIYWLCRKKLNETLVNGPALARAIGAATSMRNITTVRALAERYGRPPASR